MATPATLTPSASSAAAPAAGAPAATIFAVIGEFENPSELFQAAEQTRDQGYKRWDVYSPFPIHGMDEAMGLRKSIVSSIVAVGGLTGFLTAVALTFIPSTITYPLIVQGKPTNFLTVPAFFPILFELTVLFSAFAAVFGMLFVNRLPRWNHPLFNWDRFTRVTDDGFFLAIEATDPRFTEAGARDFLTGLGAQHVTVVRDE